MDIIAKLKSEKSEQLAAIKYLAHAVNLAEFNVDYLIKLSAILEKIKKSSNFSDESLDLAQERLSKHLLMILKDSPGDFAGVLNLPPAATEPAATEDDIIELEKPAEIHSSPSSPPPFVKKTRTSKKAIISPVISENWLQKICYAVLSSLNISLLILILRSLLLNHPTYKSIAIVYAITATTHLFFLITQYEKSLLGTRFKISLCYLFSLIGIILLSNPEFSGLLGSDVPAKYESLVLVLTFSIYALTILNEIIFSTSLTSLIRYPLILIGIFGFSPLVINQFKFGVFKIDQLLTSNIAANLISEGSIIGNFFLPLAFLTFIYETWKNIRKRSSIIWFDNLITELLILLGLTFYNSVLLQQGHLSLIDLIR